MSPREAHSPGELFGAAAQDRRSLRRAYARLVRSHGPEDDPDTFAHIRRLYEQALADLDRGEPAQAPAPVEGPEQLDALLGSATGDGVPDLLQQLRQRVVDTGDPAALDAAVGLQRAIAPADLPELWADAARHPGLHPRILEQLAGVLPMMPLLSLHPALDCLLRLLQTPAQRMRLVQLQVGNLLHRNRRHQALRLYQRLEPDLRSLPTEDWAPLFELVVGGCAWQLPQPDLLRAREQLGDATLALEDEAVDRLEDLLLRVEEQREAACDPDVPELLRRLPERAHQQHAPVRLALLRELAADLPGLPAHLEHLEQHWPTLALAVHQVIDATTGLEHYLASWHVQGEPPVRYSGLVREQVRGLRQAGEELEDARKALRRVEDRWRNINVVSNLGWMAILALAGGLFIDGEAGQLLLGLAVLGGPLAIAAGEILLGRVMRPRKQALRDQQAEAEHARSAQLDALPRDTGLWAHELAGAAAQEGLDDLASLFDSQLLDLLGPCRVAGEEHLRRARWSVIQARIQQAELEERERLEEEQ